MFDVERVSLLRESIREDGERNGGGGGGGGGRGGKTKQNRTHVQTKHAGHPVYRPNMYAQCTHDTVQKLYVRTSCTNTVFIDSSYLTG